MHLSNALPIILASLPALIGAESFADRCDQYRILPYSDEHGWILQATCPGDGYTGYSALPLDWCLINNDGTIVAQENGGLSSTCRDGCTISTGIPEVGCICDPNPDGFTQSHLDLMINIAPTVTNNDGVLECFGQKGWTTTQSSATTAV
ncbi:uncharacterized protein KD926_004989 [Aspergillus affinis]|uniref:uncharacterized protein n=1 Tax=Aspergillus affinis TaxID=1070780 RepID=UPI0022FDE50F|nr:uncharacterized protein KD926_004989 [Aspergillus affinis]KAI9034957.1 hypothetical protein KD926_004989 [Aspergillus affinis]